MKGLAHRWCYVRVRACEEACPLQMSTSGEIFVKLFVFFHGCEFHYFVWTEWKDVLLFLWYNRRCFLGEKRKLATCMYSIVRVLGSKRHINKTQNAKFLKRKSLWWTSSFITSHEKAILYIIHIFIFFCVYENLTFSFFAEVIEIFTNSIQYTFDISREWNVFSSLRVFIQVVINTKVVNE